MEGDGSGSYLHFVVEDSSRWSNRDYYVHLDFKGRRYIEMPDSAHGEIYDFERQRRDPEARGHHFASSSRSL